MLRQMRENFKSLSWTLWIVIIVFIGGFIVFGGSSFGSGEANSDIILTVGEVTVTSTTFRHNLLRTADNLRSSYGDLSKQIIRQQNLPARVMQDYINSGIIESEAETKGLMASKKEIVEKIKGYPYFQKDGKFIGAERYKQILASNRIPYKEFEDSIVKQIKADKLRELVTTGIVINNQELKESYKKEKDSAELEIIQLSLDSLKDEKITNTEEELKEYYNKNRENFKTEELRSALALTLKYKDYNKELKLTEENYYNFYKENKKNYILPAKTKVSRIFLPYEKNNRDEVKKSADALHGKLTKENFAEMAKNESKGDKAKNGGDWGYWEWKNSMPPMEQDVVKRNPQGHIATPVDTGKGYSIIFVTEKKSETQQSYVAVKESIKTRLNREALSEIVNAKAEDLYKKLKDTKDFAAAVKTAGYEALKVDKVKAGDPVKDVDNFGYLSRRAFSLKKGEVSTPSEFAEGVAILYVTDIYQPEIKTFEVAKEEVAKAVIENKKMATLKKKADKLAMDIKRASSEKQIEDLLKKHKLEAKKETYKRGDNIYSLGTMKGLDEIIFSMKKDQYSEPLDFGKTVAIVKIKEITLSQDEDFKKDRSTFYDQQLKMKKGIAFGNYIMSVRDKYPIKLNQNLFTEISTHFMNSMK